MNRKARPLFQPFKIAGLLIAAALIAAGCTNVQAGEAQEEAAVQNGPKQIKIEQVGRHSMGSPREQIGEVTAAVKFDMIAKTGGEVIERIKQNGEQVKKDEIIARISSERADTKLENAKVQLRLSEEALAASQKTNQVQRNELLNKIKEAERVYKEIRMSQDDEAAEKAADTVKLLKQQLSVMDTTNNLTSLEAQVASAEAGLKDLQLSLSDYVIKAPSDGVVTNMSLREGTYLQGGTVVGVVQRTDRIVIEVKLNELAASLVRGKQELVFYSPENKATKLKAHVNSLDVFANPKTRMFAMELEADNPNGIIKPGGRVHVELTSEDEENVIAVPSLSIIREGDETFVYVVKGTQSEKRKVQLGRLNGVYQEVLSGLSQNEQLVVGGQHQLKDAEQVEIIS
ncbi:efflux RND transporter periplasmic adaptor subunit [Paenibacillus sp. GCM10012307]|uniref:Efflux RND transporter periplasmic adaptor subunit n=1 Tax=Paenibacillus roseus TaxID=2798579 RepID=A0A934J2Y8_9BACL|nr:efflux RND transporter periplasmic adaptor subunit [Paenibacillus roseus]MBJ6360649.1 efflux RND transporter periplasmic adaptor subunit [Paenibacillus roseus]